MGKLPSEADISRYLDVKRADRPCEACGNSSWYFLPEAVRLNVAGGVTGLLEKSLSVVVIGCQNCGNIRMFPLGTVEDWLKEQQE